MRFFMSCQQSAAPEVRYALVLIKRTLNVLTCVIAISGRKMAKVKTMKKPKKSSDNVEDF